MDKTERHSRKNPKENANLLSQLVFGWMIPIFWKGARRDLVLTDMYNPLKSDESQYLGDRLQREWEKELLKSDKEFVLGNDGEKKGKKTPSLLRAIIRIIWLPYMVDGLLFFIQIMILRVLQPIFQRLVINYFGPESLTTRDEALIYAGGLVLVTLCVVLLMHHTILRAQRVGMRIRVACCSLVYRKVLRLNQAAVSNTAAGQVANLISNDVARFDVLPIYLHYIWIMPFQILLIGYILWQSVGVAALVGIGALILQTVPVQLYLTRLGAALRSRIAVRTDERVQMMSELISGIQVVKMYTWETPFQSLVSKVRALEIILIRYASYLRGFYLSVMIFSEKVALFSTLIAFVLMGNSLNAEVSFVTATFFNILQTTCAVCFPQGIIMAGEASITLKRLTNFLLMDEVKPRENVETSTGAKTQHPEKSKTNPDAERGIEIVMAKVSANWVHGQLPPTLCNISMEIKSRSLTIFVGPVGSGKSSLLNLLLDELPIGAGSLSLLAHGKNGTTRVTSRDIRISYASQDPWLFSGSVRDNILFGQPYDKLRYREVAEVCALLKDFEQLPQGDLSFVGERGASLSGGQRARVNLARAIYRDADLYLLDDPLSAVDASVSRHLFEKCIRGYLKGKTRVLVTHQVQYLPQADNIVMIDRGLVTNQGTYAELENLGIVLPDNSEQVDEVEITKKSGQNNGEVKARASISTSKCENPSEIAESNEASQDIDEEKTAKGVMSNKVYGDYFLAGGNLCALIFYTTIFVLGQVAASGNDYWLTFWTNQNIGRSEVDSIVSNTTADANYQNDTTSTTGTSIFESLQWIDEYGYIRTEIAIYIYTGCIIIATSILILRNMMFITVCMKASRNIHNLMFSNLLRAPMTFFNTNPSGRILNRFSKDVGAMDELLPRAMLEAVQILTVMAGILVMVIVVNYWMAIPAVALLAIFYVLRIFYLKTAQAIKRLEGIAKSPVFSHVSSTLDGITTIRSRYDAVEKLLKKEFDSQQDVHTGTWYLNIAAQSAFGFLLDIFSTTFIAFVCFSFILMDDGTTLGGSVGLAISQSLILTGMVQYGIRQTAEVVSQMTSVERVLQYTNLPTEGPFTTKNPPPPSWPSKGGLLFKNVSMKYREDKPPVLKDINLSIKPGWKVGVVGRTGAGKSSLISALFGLTGDGLQGEIILDDIDTKSIGLHELRPRISIIPQEPILFSASLRFNLDPFNQYSDAELWSTLREVELSTTVSSLESTVAGGGANFSVGQRQLICLARAILRNNRILVLDEATANVDRNTDALIQATIRERFAHCTVLTIAHRLNTIMDSDRVLVMEAGRTVEFDHPHLLLQNPDGYFTKMVQQTGHSTAEQLARTAEYAHQHPTKAVPEVLIINPSSDMDGGITNL